MKVPSIISIAALVFAVPAYASAGHEATALATNDSPAPTSVGQIRSDPIVSAPSSTPEAPVTNQTSVTTDATPATDTAPAASAETDSGNHKSGRARSEAERQLPRIKKRVKALADELDLTDEQQQKIAAIMMDEYKSLKEVDADTAILPDTKNLKYDWIQDSAARQIRELLTPDQAQKFDAIGPIRTKNTVPMAQINRHARMLKSRLSLTDEQQKQIVSILVEEVKLIRAVDTNKETTADEKQEQRTVILTSVKASIRNLLTDAQKASFNVMDVNLEVGKRPSS